MEKNKPFGGQLEYTFMNFALAGAVLSDPDIPNFYKGSCEYKKFL